MPEIVAVCIPSRAVVTISQIEYDRLREAESLVRVLRGEVTRLTGQVHELLDARRADHSDCLRVIEAVERLQPICIRREPDWDKVLEEVQTHVYRA